MEEARQPSAVIDLRAWFAVPERFFITIAVPLYCLYLALWSPFSDYFKGVHGTEKYLYVVTLAEKIVYPENRNKVPVGFVAFIQAANSDVLPVFGEKQSVRLKRDIKLADLWPKKVSAETKAAFSLEEKIAHKLSLFEVPLAREFLTRFKNTDRPGTYAWVGYIPYLPGALIGIILGSSPMMVAALMMISGACWGVSFGYWTVRFMPVFRWTMVILLLLPIVFLFHLFFMPDATAIDFCMPIRLLPMNTTNSRMLPFMLIQFIVGWSRYLAANTKQGAKGVMWVKSPVKSERKLIQVGL